MHTIRSQRIASTHVDRVGERLTKSFLENYAEALRGVRQPLHDRHDMSLPTVGYIENVRLEPDPDSPGDWFLVGDVYLNESAELASYGGFSISGIEMLHEPDGADARLLLAYPYYRDASLVQGFAVDPKLDIGKWIRKGSGEFEWGVLFGSLLAFAVTPVWDDIYKRKIAPRLDELLAKYLAAFESQGVGAEVVQQVVFRGEPVEVRIIPERGREATCLRSDVVALGLQVVIDFLLTDRRSNDVGVKRVVIYFNGGTAAYALHRVEYADGSVEHAA